MIAEICDGQNCGKSVSIAKYIVTLYGYDDCRFDTYDAVLAIAAIKFGGQGKVCLNSVNMYYCMLDIDRCIYRGYYYVSNSQHSTESVFNWFWTKLAIFLPISYSMC